MATAGDGRTPYESGGGGEKLHKRFWGSEINEEPQNVSQEAGQLNLAGVSDQGRNSAPCGTSELEETLKWRTFTRSEAEHLIELVHSRIMEDSPSPLTRLEASSTSGSLQRHKHGDESYNFHSAIVSSRVVEEEIASPTELANVYKGSTIGQALMQDSKLVNNIETCLPRTPMASPQHPTTMENLPNELLSNIFICLWAKQLAQMRSVSKSWNALLSQSSFINSHLHRSIHHNDQILLVFYKMFFNSKPFAAFPCRSPHLELTNFIKLPPVNPQSRHYNIRVIGAVKGLICSSYSDSVIHIWNPSLSAFLTLPLYSMPSCDNNSIEIYFRFGFDTSTNDYKVVKLMGYRELSSLVVKLWLQVEVFSEVFSMRKGLWESITERFPSHITGIFDNDVCVGGHDGHLHWLGFIHEKIDSESIVAFHLGSGIFREIPLSDSIRNYNHRFHMLGVSGGKHCVISRFWGDACEVWVMEEYGMAESWVKRHVFSQFFGDTYPFGFTSHNRFLIQDLNYRLVLYDPVSNKIEILENLRPRPYGLNKIVEYVDSLVWVAPAKRDIVDGAGQN